MDAKYLAEIKAREQAATPGPWPRDGTIFTANGINNCEFIYYARADIPALLAEVERLRNVVKIQRASCSLVETAKAANAVDEIAAKDQQIATLERALEYACADRATTPSMWQDLQKKYMELAQQAQEQEGKK